MIPSSIECSSLPSLSSPPCFGDPTRPTPSPPLHQHLLQHSPNPRLSAGSRCSPPSLPRTPLSINIDGPSPNLTMGVDGNQGGMVQDRKRRPTHLITLPPLSQLLHTESVPLSHKPSHELHNELHNIPALPNEPRRQEDYFSHQPQSRAPQHTLPHLPQHHHKTPPYHHPHAVHHDVMAAGGVPPKSSSARLVYPDARYYAPDRFDYRPPRALHPHPYGGPDGRRHTSAYHTLEYPPYYDVTQYPPGHVGIPSNANIGTRAPITRTTKACNACRARKVRCDDGGHRGSTGTCLRCRESGRVCVYTATQKKDGLCPGRPPNRRAVILSAACASSAATATADIVKSSQDRRSWSMSPGTSAHLFTAVPTSAPPCQQEWLYSSPSSAPYEADARHHPFRKSREAGSGPRIAPLVVEREHRPGVWDDEARYAPTFDAGYQLLPHPSAG